MNAVAYLLALALSTAVPVSSDNAVVVLHVAPHTTSTIALEELERCLSGPHPAVLTFEVGRPLVVRMLASPAVSFSEFAKSSSMKTALAALSKDLATAGPRPTLVVISRDVDLGPRDTVGDIVAISPRNADTELLGYERTRQQSQLSPFRRSAIDGEFLRARDALRKGGVRVVSVNIGGRYSEGLKALAEATGGIYLQSHRENELPEGLDKAVCGR